MNQELLIEQLLKTIELQNKQIEMLQKEKEELKTEKAELKAENLTLKVKVDEFAARTPTQPKSSVPKVPEPPKPTQPPEPPKTPQPPKTKKKEPPRPVRTPDYKGKLEEMVQTIGEFIGETFKVDAIIKSKNFDDIVEYAAVETNWLQRLIDTYDAYLTFEPGTDVPPQVTYIVQEIFDTFYDDVYDRFLSNY